MNLSPDWVPEFKTNGYEAKHWSKTGKVDAEDIEILFWAKENKYIVFTNDLDFGSLLASTQGNFPSIFQVRTHDVTPGHLASLVFKTLKQFKDHLERGAIVTLDERKARIRILPIK